MRHFLGIKREAVFSPGRVDDDAQILFAVADQLRESGHRVDVIDAEQTSWPQPEPQTVVFTMAQGETALRRLQQWEEAGVRVINSVEGVRNCQRYRTVPRLSAGDVAFPASQIVSSGSAFAAPRWLGASAAWIKRGDVHATEADDVVFVEDVDAARDALQRFAQRGIERAVIQHHVPGTVIKFYAVRGDFFFHVPPADTTLLSPSLIRGIDTLGRRAAAALSVEVYGGDCVVADDGALTLIDLNDWPSYARCRFSAAAAIAAYVGAQGTTRT